MEPTPKKLSVDPNPNPTLLSDHTIPGLSGFAIFYLHPVR